VSGTTSPHTITEEIIDRITDDRCAKSPAYIGTDDELLKLSIRHELRRQVVMELDNLCTPKEAA
jgi:hypothetical protein